MKMLIMVIVTNNLGCIQDKMNLPNLSFSAAIVEYYKENASHQS